MTATMLRTARLFVIALGFGAAVLFTSTMKGAVADTGTIRVGLQFGLAYLPLLVMKNQGLVEAEARKLGLTDTKTVWQQIGNGIAINESLLSDSLDIASGGVTPFLAIWDKTRGAVKGVAALEALPMYLVTNRPDIRSLADFKDSDKIALVSNKIGTMAVVLQMASEKLWGVGNHTRMDRSAITMRHPEAVAALITGRTEITAYFGSPPYQEQALESPGIHKVLSSYDVFGGPHIFNMVWTKSAFRDRNPLLYKAFYNALIEGQRFIAAKPDEAIRIYIEEEQPKGSPDKLLQIIRNPDITFTAAPINIMVFASFMKRIGLIRNAPGSWQDLFLPEVHNQPGS